MHASLGTEKRMEGAPDVPAPNTVAPAVTAAVPSTLRARRRVRTAASMALQVILIALGVFLGLAGEEWRQGRENHRLAAEMLQRFRTEIAANRTMLMSVKDYHAERLAELKTYFAAPAEARDATIVKFTGLRPPFFERTAWDLALATQSLAYIDANLAFALSRTYSFQNVTNELGRGVLDAMYTRPPTEADNNFFVVLELYYGDLGGLEPGLVAAYDQLLPAIDEALAD